MDGAQEHLHYVVDICNEDLYLLDPVDPRLEEEEVAVSTFGLVNPPDSTPVPCSRAQEGGEDCVSRRETEERCLGISDPEQISIGSNTSFFSARETKVLGSQTSVDEQNPATAVTAAHQRLSGAVSSSPTRLVPRHVTEPTASLDPVFPSSRMQSTDSNVKKAAPVKAYSESDGTVKRTLPTRTVQFLLCKQSSVNENLSQDQRPTKESEEGSESRCEGRDVPMRKAVSPTPPPLPPRSPHPILLSGSRSASCDSPAVTRRSGSPQGTRRTPPPLPPERQVTARVPVSGDELMHQLVQAVRVNDVVQIRRLHECGCVLSAVRDRSDMSVLHYAAAAGREEIVQFLIDKCPKELLDQQDRDGRTALHVAVESKNRRISGLLALAGASLSLRSSHSLTAQETALKVGDEHLAAYLNRKSDSHVSPQAINKRKPLTSLSYQTSPSTSQLGKAASRPCDHRSLT